MSKKSFAYFLSIGLAFCVIPFVYAQDSLRLSTFYPAPFGAYDRVRLVPRDPLPASCDEGTIYYNDIDNALMICGNSGNWETPGVWTQTGNFIYPKDSNASIGIGTTTPSSPLEVYGSSTAIYGEADIGIHGFGSNYGVYGENPLIGGGTGVGVYGKGENYGVWGESDTGTGGFFTSTGGGHAFVTDQGNVGVGTLAPDSSVLMHVDNVSGYLVSQYINGGGTYSLYISNSDGLGAGILSGSANIGIYGVVVNRGVMGQGDNYGGYFWSDNNVGIYAQSFASGGIAGEFIGAIDVSTDANIQGNLTVGVSGVGGDGIFNNDLSVTGTLTAGNFSVGNFTVDDLIVNNDADIGGTLTTENLDVDQDANIDGNLTIVGDLDVQGSTKNFIQPHPVDPSKELVYTSIEGRDVRIFFDGVAQLKNGQAIIKIPEDFQYIASRKVPLNIILTPFGKASLYVRQRSPDRISVAATEETDIEFGYLVIATRGGYEDSRPVQGNRHFRPDQAGDVKEFEGRYKVIERDSYYRRLGKRLNRKLLIQNRILNKDGTLNRKLSRELHWKISEATVVELRKELK